MSLLEGVDGNVTQRYGVPSAGVSSLEPAMWSTGNKAYWQPYVAASYFPHFHPGIDIANVEGTPIHAMEAGTVTFANLRDYISGIQVEVEIRPGTRYSFNHLSRVAVAKGAKVRKGQVIGYIGSTGYATGPHAHQAVSHLEIDAYGTARTFLYNPALFYAGGGFANVAWIQPIAAKTLYVALNGAGINIRTGPGYQYAVWGTSRLTGSHGAGIYRSNGAYYAGLTSRFIFKNWSADGLWAKVVTGSTTLYIYRSLIHFA